MSLANGTTIACATCLDARRASRPEYKVFEVWVNKTTLAHHAKSGLFVMALRLG